MRVTNFRLANGDRVVPEVVESPQWKPFEHWEGQPLERVHLAEFDDAPGTDFQLVHIGVGGKFVMHASKDLAFCQVVHGAGTLELPDGIRLLYQGPELYIFRPHTLHAWRDIREDTLLSVCLVGQGHAG